MNQIIEKKRTYITIFSIILFFLIIHHLIINPLISLPSPIYGGDYYHQLGTTNHVKYGGSPLKSPNIKGSLPIYFVLYSTITGNLSKFLELDAITTEFFFSYIIILFSAIIFFFLTKKIFKDNELALIACLIFISAAKMPILKYTDFAYILMMPLFLLSIYDFIIKKNIKNIIKLGIIYGLLGLTHSIAFISASLLFTGAFIYYTLFQNINIKEKKINFNKIKKEFFAYSLVLLIGIPIALLWWYKPLFIYHGHTSLYYNDWNNQNWADIRLQISFLFSTLKNSFFNISSIRSTLISIFGLFGITGLLLIKKDHEKTSEQSHIYFLTVSAFIITFHYLITRNLFDFDFIPNYIATLLLTPILVLLTIFGLKFSYSIIKKSKIPKKLYFLLIILILLLGQSQAYQQRINDVWYNAGKNELPAQLVNLEKYLVKESNVNDVILTTKEIGFAVNALTGRKLLTCRRAQNDPFLDMDSRELAQAIILYGNNTEYKKELIKQYNISYLYWDYYWIESEYYTNKNGRVTGWFDPLIMFYSEEKEKILQENNISYFVENTWVDPAMKGENYKIFKLIFISPVNYYNSTHPWNPNLNPYLDKVWDYTSEDQEIAKLYKFNIN